jgi:ribosomal protein S18 acetylase RimI-like enzyme
MAHGLMIIRLGAIEDLDALCEIEHAAFRCNRISRRSFRYFIQRSNALVLVAKHDDTILGYAVVVFRPDGARLYSIAVRKNAQGQGVGSWLLHEVVRQTKGMRLRLVVGVYNVTARHLYRRHGFETIGCAVGYYADGSDAHRMERRA